MSSHDFLVALAEAFEAKTMLGTTLVEPLNVGTSFDRRITRARFDLRGHSCIVWSQQDRMILDPVDVVLERLESVLADAYSRHRHYEPSIEIELPLKDAAT